jgi:hypothetical protein
MYVGRVDTTFGHVFARGLVQLTMDASFDNPKYAIIDQMVAHISVFEDRLSEIFH